MRRTMTTTVSLVAGALLLGACSGSDPSAEAAEAPGSESAEAVAAFCDGARALYDQFISAGINDPANPAVQEVFAAAQELSPPAEIAVDWQTILDSLEPLVSGQVDVQDPAAMAQFGQEAAANAAAYERVGTYSNQTCGIGPSATTIPPGPAPAPGDPAVSPAPVDPAAPAPAPAPQAPSGPAAPDAP